jgi:putative toxin-antitoxin system antitoxin component (TIGR02293 family)
MSLESQIVSFIGIENIAPNQRKSDLSDYNAFDLAAIEKAGIFAPAIDNLLELLQLPRSLVASWIKVSPKTIARRKKNHELLAVEGTSNLIGILRVLAIGLEVLKDMDTLITWLNEPNSAMGGIKPMELIDTDSGAHELIKEFRRIQWGNLA